MKKIVLSTRLILPKPRQNYIIRQSLFRQLEQIKDKRLTIIKGAPGSGKTTLLTSYLEQNLLKVRWLTLDEECNDIPLFWAYAAEALSGLTGSKAVEFTSYLNGNSDIGIHEMLKILINAFDSQEETYLVLDNFQVIQSSELIKSIEYFITNAPADFHIILLTREQPKLYLMGYEIQGELLRIEEENLWMDEEEGMLFLKQTLQLQFSDEVLLELVHKSGGWIGGLQLLAATLPGKPVKRVNSLLVYDYITNEIWSMLKQEEQQFLIATAVPAYFSPKAAEYLVPGIDSGAMISALLDKNLMLQCIDEEQGLYQYHNLLRDYLLTQFEEVHKDEKNQIYRKAARIFHELGDEEESLRHLFLLEDYKMAMSRILDMPHNAAHFSYMKKIPVLHAGTNFDFAFQKFFYHYYIYDYNTCFALYQEGAKYAMDDKRYEAFFGTTLLFNQEAFVPGEELITTGQVREIDSYPLTKALILTKNAAFQFHQGKFNDALESVNESMEFEKSNSGTYIHYFNLTLKAQIYEEMGMLNKAEAVQEQTHQLINKNKLLRQLHLPTFYVTIAGLYLKQMKLKEAEETLNACKAEAAERGGQLKLSYDYNWIEYLYLTGDDEEAGKLLHSLMTTKPYEDLIVVSSLLKLMDRTGTMSSALKEQFIAAYEEELKENRPLNSRLLYARIIHSMGRWEKASSILDDVMSIARRQNYCLKIVEANLQKLSILISSSKDIRRIADLYKEVLYYASENNIRQPFFIEGDTVLTIHQKCPLTHLAKNEKTFHEEIVRCCTAKDNSILSEREMEILKAIAEGLTNNGIAECFFISLPTVKTHISNIYRKLEVKTRVTALEKARSMGILSYK